MTLETSIEFVKGIGPERAKLIKNVLGMSTVEDLLHFYPIRYIDKNKVYKIGNLQESNLEIQLKGKISNVQEIHNGKIKRLTARYFLHRFSAIISPEQRNSNKSQHNSDQ